ncbi:MAG: galactose mutarotase [Lachnospiraceae bacterium]|nr:galactose mutarotase [Lachnospiraceae bacterium]
MIECLKFGTTKEGKEASIYILENDSGMHVQVSDFGALILTIMFPDRNGEIKDITLGFDELKDYYNTDTCFGAYVGRNANRIKNACVILDDKEYKLDKNDGENNLHSGFVRSHCKMYDARYGKSKEGNYVEFSRLSPKFEQGFPGDLEQRIRYTLTDNNELIIDYRMATNETTVVNPTNHTYFNLNGQDNGNILQHQLEIYANSFLEIDEDFVPTGNILNVENTPMDFRIKKIIGKQIDYNDVQIRRAKGYDHNYVFTNDGKLKKMAKLYCDESGITMTVYSDLCGMQLYTGNFLDGVVGKGGTRYEEKAGICFETQYYPNACNEEHFPSNVLKAGQTYKSRTIYELAIS